MPRRHARAYIGTSGWNYKDWKTDFYGGLPQSRWLERIVAVFDSVEVNHSFYRFPTSPTVSDWAAAVPNRFRISFKMWRGVSHFRKLTDSHRYLHDYFRALDHVPTPKRGAVLVQLPPNQKRDDEKLDAFIARAKKIMRPANWRLAFEFRHDSWLHDGTYSLCDKHRVAICVHDMEGRGATTEPNDATFVYLRRHGPGGNVRASYTRAAIASDARRVRGWLDDGRTVFAYYNNDVGGHAPRNAQALAAGIG